MPSDAEFETLVNHHYQGLYQFAYSLTRMDADARDLTQETFYIWATKGHQLRDSTKVKTWLFSTLHREFLNSRRRGKRFPHFELSQVEGELPGVLSPHEQQLDCHQVVRALGQVDAVFQAPVALFYLQDCPYRDIAEILGIPIGTVKSRIARGLDQLHGLLEEPSNISLEKGET